MVKNDYVGVYWVGTDIDTDPEYEYFSYVSFNEAVWETKVLCHQAVVKENRQQIYNEIAEQIQNKWPDIEFVDALEMVMDKFIQFEVWRVLPEAPREAIEDLFDYDPDTFLRRWCVREV